MTQNINLKLMNWLDNLKDNKLNDEILCIFIKNKIENISNKIVDIFTKNDINFDLYQIFYSQDFEHISNIKSNSNIILICDIGMNIVKINNSDSKLICILFNNLTYNLQHNTPSLFEYIYIDKEDPLSILKLYSTKNKNDDVQSYRKDYYHIAYLYKIIFSKFNYYGNIKSLKSDNLLSSKFFENELEYDLNVLCYRNILTSKLAIALYKITTLKFNDSNTKIGTYYKKNLGITSKTTQLPNFEKEKIIMKMLREKKIEISPLEAVNYYNKNKDKFEEKEIKYISNLPIFRAKAYNLNKATLL